AVKNPAKTLVTVMIVGILVCGCASTPTTQNNTAKRAPDETSALDAVHKTTEAQSIYFKLNRRYALTYDELVDARLLKTEPTAAQTGYDFKLRPAPDAQTYKLYVAPADSTATTARHFFTDQTGNIHAEIGKDASSDSPTPQ